MAVQCLGSDDIMSCIKSSAVEGVGPWSLALGFWSLVLGVKDQSVLIRLCAQTAVTICGSVFVSILTVVPADLHQEWREEQDEIGDAHYIADPRDDKKRDPRELEIEKVDKLLEQAHKNQIHQE